MGKFTTLALLLTAFISTNEVYASTSSINNVAQGI